ncbi:outer membrane protein assembly factor BamB family protein [Sunxiuqinia sp. A32]|uniref:outer membrane protein assembly factor BamB family protein n=1 Tax=Sunxiuqinia sp. A32 TaxID=3461496 RepID=UPI00404617B6
MQLKPSIFILSTLLFITFLISCNSQKEQWTHLRGSNLDGHATSAAPVNWSETNNITWKTKLSGKAWSSPVVWDDQIWMTSATSNGDSLFAFCHDFNSGQLLKKINLLEPKNIQVIHSTNSYASSTPCIEDGFVYVHFGTYLTACINTKNFEVVWSRMDMNCEHMQGAASSPIIYKDLLIVHLEGTDVQDIYALDKHTGKTIWKVGCPDEKVYEEEPPVSRKSYQTPIIVNIDGKDQLITNRALFAISYDPNTGEENWRIYYGEDSSVSMPVYYNGLVMVNSGWVVSQGLPYFARLFAVDPTGKGDVTETNIVWETGKNAPQTSTPVVVDSLMFMIEERGNVSCLNPGNGEIYWEEKLKGHFNISPIYSGGNIYFTNTKGETTIIKAAPIFEKVAENELDGVFKATPAILRGSIIQRSDKYLYRIENQK